MAKKGRGAVRDNCLVRKHNFLVLPYLEAAA